jgi:hypothetical protein
MEVEERTPASVHHELASALSVSGVVGDVEGRANYYGTLGGQSELHIPEVKVVS